MNSHRPSPDDAGQDGGTTTACSKRHCTPDDQKAKATHEQGLKVLEAMGFQIHTIRKAQLQLVRSDLRIDYWPAPRRWRAFGWMYPGDGNTIRIMFDHGLLHLPVDADGGRHRDHCEC